MSIQGIYRVHTLSEIFTYLYRYGRRYIIPFKIKIKVSPCATPEASRYIVKNIALWAFIALRHTIRLGVGYRRCMGVFRANRAIVRQALLRTPICAPYIVGMGGRQSA